MTLSEIEFNELVEKVKQALATGSQGVGDVPEAVDLNGISTLPAYQEVEGQDIPNIVRAPLTLLAAPALEASKIANEEEAKRTVAETGRVTAEEQRVTEFSKIKTDAEKATDDAIAAANRVDESITDVSTEKQAAIEATAKANASGAKADASAENADAKALLANLAAEAATAAASLADEKAGLAATAATNANTAAGTIDSKMQDKINALIANAPEALDTLVELAAALGNDPNFATTVATELAKKINKADIVNDLITGGVDKVASAETVKTLDGSKIGSLFFTTISRPMTTTEFAEIVIPDTNTLYIVTLPS